MEGRLPPEDAEIGLEKSRITQPQFRERRRTETMIKTNQPAMDSQP